jgi:hypothetical protein
MFEKYERDNRDKKDAFLFGVHQKYVPDTWDKSDKLDKLGVAASESQ